jgi:hypothetical protein
VPLVRIDAPTADPALPAGLGEAVHAALVEAIGIPPDDRFQVLQGAGATRVSYDRRYLGVQRDDGFALVQVFLRGGRTDEQKRAFYRALADRAAGLGVEPRNLMVVLTENTVADWSFGEGVAQYLEPR